MRGVSAKSLSELLKAVDDKAGGGADTGTVGDELFAVVSLLDGEPALRRVLTDPSTTADGKRQLAGSVLTGKIGEDSLDLVRTAVAGRWASSRDLTDALEQAGVAAHVGGAAARGELDDVEDELFRFGRTVSGSPELRGVLTDRSVPSEPKQRLVESLLSGKGSPTTLALAKQASAARAHGFEATLADFGDLAAARRERLVATARVAYALGDEERQRLADALAQQYGREVHVNVIVDPDVIGGISVEIGEDIIDGTVSGRLEDARRRIAG